MWFLDALCHFIASLGDYIYQAFLYFFVWCACMYFDYLWNMCVADSDKYLQMNLAVISKEAVWTAEDSDS